VPITVVFSPEAEEQLIKLYHYVSLAASPNIAENYTSAIITYCEGVSNFPFRCISRDDIRQGILITNYKRRTVIAYTVTVDLVSIIGIFYGGQDYESMF